MRRVHADAIFWIASTFTVGALFGVICAIASMGI